jgi:hypothetical protein
MHSMTSWLENMVGRLWFSLNPLPLMMIRMLQNSNSHTTLVNS